MLLLQTIGNSVPPVRGTDRVTGRVGYGVNLELPGMVHAKVLRSPHAHARVVRLDTRRAAQAPGVVAVLTHEDFVRWGIDPVYGPVVRDQPILAGERVRYVGEPVVAVAAVDAAAAEAALDLVDVAYDPLPFVLDPLEALRAGAPRVHENIAEIAARHGFMLVQELHLGGDGQPNCCSRFQVRHGDVDSGFARSDVVFEQRYRWPVQHQAYLEPNAVVARFHEEGGIEVWTGTQSLPSVREALAHTFKLPFNRVRVRVPPMGGGFGGRVHPKTEPLVCALARKAGRPVKLVLSREEVFLTVCEHGVVVDIRTGVRRDGTIVARSATSYFDAGAYADISPRTSKNSCYVMCGPYRIPNVHLQTWCVYTHKVPSGALRGFGVTQVAWAHEQEMDRIARALALDPVDFRRRNLVHDGDTFVTGQTLDCITCEESLDAVLGALGPAPAPAPAAAAKRRGRGVATIIKTTVTPSFSAAAARLEEDGSLSVLTSSVDLGQGKDTALAQIAADAMGVPLQRVQVLPPDSGTTPFDQGAISSRTVFSMGNAIAAACDEIRQRVLAMAAGQMEARPEDLDIADGQVFVRGAPDRAAPIERVVRRGLGNWNGTLQGHGIFKTEGGVDPEHGQGIATAVWFTAACGAEVEVDAETGKVRVLNLVGAGNCGRAVHPVQVQGQLDGSLGMALSLALYEEMRFADGQPLNATFLDYHLATIADTPPSMCSIALERPHPKARFGAIGIGDTVGPAVAAAIGNAVFDAVGVQVREAPLTPERVLQAMRGRDGAGRENAG